MTLAYFFIYNKRQKDLLFLYGGKIDNLLLDSRVYQSTLVDFVEINRLNDLQYVVGFNTYRTRVLLLVSDTCEFCHQAIKEMFLLLLLSDDHYLAIEVRTNNVYFNIESFLNGILSDIDLSLEKFEVSKLSDDHKMSTTTSAVLGFDLSKYPQFIVGDKLVSPNYSPEQLKIALVMQKYKNKK